MLSRPSTSPAFAEATLFDIQGNEDASSRVGPRQRHIARRLRQQQSNRKLGAEKGMLAQWTVKIVFGVLCIELCNWLFVGGHVQLRLGT